MVTERSCLLERQEYQSDSSSPCGLNTKREMLLIYLIYFITALHMFSSCYLLHISSCSGPIEEGKQNLMRTRNLCTYFLKGIFECSCTAKGAVLQALNVTWCSSEVVFLLCLGRIALWAHFDRLAHLWHIRQGIYLKLEFIYYWCVRIIHVTQQPVRFCVTGWLLLDLYRYIFYNIYN